MKFSHPAWSYSSSIYEVNVRQYTREGTFRAFQDHLPRLRDMGVEILWLMPITPISTKGRKGSLGSYYAVHNYTSINPEFGSLEDLISLVKNAHDLGFKIIIDWVANHTGNDNVWIDEHPDFFNYDAATQLIHPNGWDDVSKLNYDNQQMQEAMIAAMQYWIDTADIDGFRCDMAHLVPLEFWKKARASLHRVKADLFWLAECEEARYHEVFDATYTWKWMHATEEFCKLNVGVENLFNLLKEYDHTFPEDAFRVYFTSNHDENSWNGTEYDKYGALSKVFSVFSCTWNGLPMIYSGQELPNYKKLQFFDKDEIEWKQECGLHDFYKTLLHLRKTNTALRAADSNVITYKIDTNYNDRVFSYVRKCGNEEVMVILNLSAENVVLQITHGLLMGRFINVFNKQVIDFSTTHSIQLPESGYVLLEKEKPSKEEGFV